MNASAGFQASKLRSYRGLALWRLRGTTGPSGHASPTTVVSSTAPLLPTSVAARSLVNLAGKAFRFGFCIDL